MLSEISDAVACPAGFVAAQAFLTSIQAESIFCCPTSYNFDPTHLPTTFTTIPLPCVAALSNAQRPPIDLKAAPAVAIPLPTTLQTIPITASSHPEHAEDLRRRATTTSSASAKSTSSKTTSKTTSTTSSNSPTSTSKPHSKIHLKTWVKIVIIILVILFIFSFLSLLCCCFRCCFPKKHRSREVVVMAPQMNVNPAGMNGYGGGNAYGLGGGSNPTSQAPYGSNVGLGLGVGGANGRTKENISGYESYRGEAAARASLQEQREQVGLGPDGQGYGNGKGKDKMVMSSVDLGQR